MSNDNVNTSDVSLFPKISEDLDDNNENPITEIESFCTNCEENVQRSSFKISMHKLIYIGNNKNIIKNHSKFW